MRPVLRLGFWLLGLGLFSSACDKLPTAPRVTCKPWAGVPDTAKRGGFTVRAHPESTCAVK